MSSVDALSRGCKSPCRIFLSHTGLPDSCAFRDTSLDLLALQKVKSLTMKIATVSAMASLVSFYRRETERAPFVVLRKISPWASLSRFR